MGYSVMAEFPSVKLRDQVMEFLERNLTPIHELVSEETPYVRGPDIDPAYHGKKHAKRLIGFDFTTSHNLQSRVAYLLCYWMAKRVPGVRVWYDGLDVLEIPDECDDDGFHPLESHELRTIQRHKDAGLLDFVSYAQAEADEIAVLNPQVKAELNKLTQLFQQDK